jgi:hypothetical protein
VSVEGKTMAEVKNLVSFVTKHKARKINISSNNVAREIAGFARREWIGGVLESVVPPAAVELARHECNEICNKYIFS